MSSQKYPKSERVACSICRDRSVRGPILEHQLIVGRRVVALANQQGESRSAHCVFASNQRHSVADERSCDVGDDMDPQHHGIMGAVEPRAKIGVTILQHHPMVFGSDLDSIENISSVGDKVDVFLRRLSHSPEIVADILVFVIDNGEGSDLDTQGLATEVRKGIDGGWLLILGELKLCACGDQALASGDDRDVTGGW